MSNSSLVEYTRISPSKNSPRNEKISKITIHHMAGVATLEQFGETVARASRKMSSNYAIDKNARVGLFCDEGDRSWCSSSAWNDHRAITIEVSNSATTANWPVSDKVYAKLIDLCVDICQRNNIKELTYTGDKNGSLTFHRFFSATACIPVDSEVLTSQGWVPIRDVQIGTPIATVNPNDLQIQFNPIENIVEPYNADVYTVSDFTCTDNHRVLVMNPETYNNEFIEFKDLDSHEYRIPSAGFASRTGLNITSSEMVFILEFQRIGSYNYDENSLEFSYIVESKAAYLDTLLNNIGLKYTRHQEDLGPVKFTVTDPRAWFLVRTYLSDKEFNWEWLNMSPTQFSYFVYKITKHEDGTWRRIYTSDSLVNIDIIQAICTLNSRGTKFDKNTNTIFIGEPYRLYNPTKRSISTDTVSCVTVNTGCFVTRMNGVVTITGNCPGPYLFSRANDICEKVNARLKYTTTTPTPVVTEPTITPVTLKAGVLVSLASNAVYYDGKTIPSWVKKLNWYVLSVSGERVVLGKNESGNFNINSAVNKKYLTVIQNASAQPSQTAFVEYTRTIQAGTSIFKISGTTVTVSSIVKTKGVYTITAEQTVAGVKYGKLKSGIGWIRIGTDNTIVDSTIRVGDKVSVVTAKTYEGKTFKVYASSYKVLEVKGDRVVISSDGKNVTAAVKASYLKKL